MKDTDARTPEWKSCRQGFLLMVWGFLFLLQLPPVRLGGTSLQLPNAVGWVFALLALHKLRGAMPVRRLAVVAACGLVLSIPLLGGVVEVGSPASLWAFAGIGTAAVILAWRLCGLVRGIARVLDRKDVARRAVLCRSVYFLNFGVLLLHPLLPLMSRAGAKSLLYGVLAIGILGLVAPAYVTMMIMGLMGTAARMCSLAERAGAAAPGDVTHTADPGKKEPDGHSPADGPGCTT